MLNLTPLATPWWDPPVIRIFFQHYPSVPSRKFFFTSSLWLWSAHLCTVPAFFLFVFFFSIGLIFSDASSSVLRCPRPARPRRRSCSRGRPLAARENLTHADTPAPLAVQPPSRLTWELLARAADAWELLVRAVDAWKLLARAAAEEQLDSTAWELLAHDEEDAWLGKHETDK